MNRTTDLCLTALAPIIWGSSYIVTTEMLPDGFPLTVALLRALPAGLILLLVVRQLPPAGWRARVFILGALNFAVFWSMLFVAAYRLPGGVAATLGAIQPLLVLFLARFALGSGITMLGVIAAISGLIGVAMLVLGPTSSLDPIGIAAALFGAASMAAGTVMTRKWQPPVSPLTFTAWQLTAGGILMIPVALILEPGFPPDRNQSGWSGVARSDRGGPDLLPVVPGHCAPWPNDGDKLWLFKPDQCRFAGLDHPGRGPEPASDRRRDCCVGQHLARSAGGAPGTGANQQTGPAHNLKTDAPHI